MSDFQKKPPYKNEFYIEYLRDLGCCVTGCSENCDFTPHHMETGGMGMKGSDLITLRICGIHHTELHLIGPGKFQDKYKVNIFQEIVRAWHDYVTALIKYTESLDGDFKALKKENKAMSAKLEKRKKRKS